MEADDLPSIDPNIDYRKILPIHQKRTIAFINHFIMNTVSFLNHFAQSCESRLMDFEYKLQKVEASLLILESQLSSISDLNGIDVAAETPPEPKLALPNANSTDAEEDPTSVSLDVPDDAREEDRGSPGVPDVTEGPKAVQDARFAKFFKMVQFGVPAAAVKLKMKSEGLDPNVLDKPNEVIPGYLVAENSDSESNSSNSV